MGNESSPVDTQTMKQKGQCVRPDLSQLRKELPPYFTQQSASKVLGGLISHRTLANLDSRHEGPPRVTLGKKIGYEREAFLNWLGNRLTTK